MAKDADIIGVCMGNPLTAESPERTYCFVK
jgi:hypothetical protein